MKKQFLKIAKELGFELPTIRYERPERDAVVYFVSVYKNGKLISVWDGGYFIGEVGTANSKDRLLIDFREYLQSVEGTPITAS